MLLINFVLGCVAVSLMALVLWQMRAHLAPRRSIRRMTAGDWMRLGVAVFHVKGLVRISYYDVWTLGLLWERSAHVAIANSLFAALAIVGSLCVLWAFRSE